jgi:transcription elongation factor GreA
MGDLSENAEYKSALERQAYVKARIAQLRERLAALSQVSLRQVPADKVGIGSTVTLLDLDSDEEVTYELVFPEVADLARGWISIASPIGRSLVGRAEGDTVKVRIPSGTKRFEVLELATLHDKTPASE